MSPPVARPMGGRSACHRYPARGFTLLELLVVLVLMGLAVSITPPLFSSAVPSLRLKGAARDMVASMRHARGQAISSNTPTPVRVDPAAGSFQVPGQPGIRHLPEDIKARVLPPLDDGDGPAIRDVWFYPDGTSSAETVILKRDDSGYRVEVDWLTGRASIHGLSEDDQQAYP